jgi:pimeloyl-ACP methyl ester carboxylesterase
MAAGAFLQLACAALLAQQPAPTPAATPALAPKHAATIGDAYAVGAKAAWVYEQGGVTIGHAWWDYAGPLADIAPPAHRFVGGWRVEQQGPLGKLELRCSGEIVLDDHGHPLRGSIASEAAGTRGVLDFAVADGQLTGTRTQGPTTQPIRCAADPGALLLFNNWIGLIEIVTKLAPPSDGPERALPLLHPESGTTLRYTLRDLGDFDVKRDGAEVRGRKYRDSIGEVVRVLPDGTLFEVEIAAQGIRIRRSDEAVERFEIERPQPITRDFDSEEVTIDRGGWTLAGSFTRPRGATGRLPALFFVRGSGLQDREGMAGGIDLGTHELLDHLTQAGFAVLRVDDRAVGKSGGPTDGVSFDDLVADARACVDWLLKRPDVDAARVVVIGHSEGGETAPLLACERPLAAIVLMAAPGRTMVEILREQKRAGLAAAGVAEALIASELEVHAKFLELVTGDGAIDPSQVRVDYRPSLAQRAWFQSHAKHDPIAQIAKVKCPVLIAQGGKDVQVSAERDAPRLLEALQKSGNASAELALFPDLDHLFKKVLSDPPTTADYLKIRPVDPEFMDKVTTWITAHTR